MNSPAQPPEAVPDHVRLPANGTTTAAEALRNDLVCAARLGTTLVVDGSEVETVGQAVLQLLIAARRDATAAGSPLTIINASDAFRTRVDACCLADVIGLEPGKAPEL